MKAPNEIEKLTQQVLNSLDHLQPAEANAYLYAKIKNRMALNRQSEATVNIRLLLRLSAVLILFLCINLTSIYLFNKVQPNSSGAKETPGITAVSEEYFPKADAYSY